MDSLEAYRSKRDASQTPEPFGGAATPPVGALRQFCVQKHAARHLHYDLRLEWGGVLMSWAVPRGPSYDQADKRVAIQTEDHPLDYADFEGIIPEGNYGAGEMVVWDRGVWIPLEDPDEGLVKGKLLFELRGYKLRGKWTLVKIKKSEKDWLLIKERDSYMRADAPAFDEASVLSGLTVEELRAAPERASAIRAELERLDAPARAVRFADVEPMLAESVDAPFDHPDWIYEFKFDGYRFLAARSGASAMLRTRNGHDWSTSFPDVVRALESLPFERFIVDGEIVVHDENGLPSFQRLQKRARLSRAPDIRRAAIELPATFYLFDLLAFDGFDARPLPLIERKRLLRLILPHTGPLRFSDHIPELGTALYGQVEQLGLEGIVAKRAASPYRGGRWADWKKVRALRTDEFVVVGWKSSSGARGTFGSLLLGTHVNGTLTYAGSVGTGFNKRQMDELLAQLAPLAVKTPPCAGAPKGATHHWVEPRHVVEVRYVEWTGEGQLRQPVFLRMRDDVAPDACVRRDVIAELPPGTVETPVATATRDEPARAVRFSNLDKVFWPEDGYTKGDLVEYYRTISPWMLPYLEDRPLVLTRFPDGIHGKSFFQKDAPDFAPAWLRTETLWSEGSERELRYFVGGELPTLLYVANSASIPLHVWASRVDSLDKPDWCIIDLDPKDAPFSDVVEVANAVHALCTDIALPAYIKSSGSSGLHVMVPLGRQVTHEQSKQIGELIARVVVKELPEIATITRIISQRQGKVYLDYLQNGSGKLLVAPFCVRPLPGAPVSMPLEWKEVNRKLDIRKFTIRNAVARMKKLKHDPLRPVLDEAPDLVHALEGLAKRL